MGKKKEFKTAKRDSVFSEIGEFCYLSKDTDFLEVTGWSNGDGFDVNLSSYNGEQNMSLTYGQYKLLKKLIKQLNEILDE